MPALAPFIVAVCTLFGIQISEDVAELLANNLSTTLGAFATLIYALARAMQAWRDRK